MREGGRENLEGERGGEGERKRDRDVPTLIWGGGKDLCNGWNDPETEILKGRDRERGK